MRDHDALRITKFNGLYDNGFDEAVPVDHFRSCQNLTFTKRGFQTREGSSLSLTKANLRRMAIYRITGEAQRLLLLDSSGNIFDSTDLVTPILTIGSMTDFSTVTMFNRAYITPHDGVTGLAGQSVYVYTGAGVARTAAGAAPTGFTLGLADSGSSGKIEAGLHAIGVSYVTNTGFLTKPGGFASITNVGGRKLDISSIPVGPAYVTARVLIGSKIITDFDGNFLNVVYYLIPDGTINNNTATTLTVDFYDSELQSDASYLLDQLETIPAGVCISNCVGRLVVGGENTAPSAARVSKSGEAESFDATEGFFLANPGDAGSGIKRIWTHGSTIIVAKSQRSYITSDTGDNAVFWKVDELDPSVGTEPHGVAQILDYGETTEDMGVVADRSGLRVFNGTFSHELISYKIGDVWGRINKAAFKTIEVVLDPINKRIYVAVPLDSATSPSHVLFADYSDGLTAANVNWSPWLFPIGSQSIVVDVNITTGLPVFKYAGRTGNVYYLDPTVLNDFGNAIDNWAEYAFLPHEADKKTREGSYHFAGVSIRVRGAGTLVLTAESQDSVQSVTLEPITLASAPGADYFRLMNLTAQKCSVKMRVNSASGQMFCSKFSLLSKWMWSEVAS